MKRKTQINLTVTVEFEDDETSTDMVASDLAWNLIQEFGEDNAWNAERDDKLVVLHISSSEVQS